MPREILVDWVTPAGGGFRSVTYWSETPAVVDQRAALATFLGAVDNFLDSGVTWSIETTGREMTDAEGTLTDIWSETTARGGTGGVAGNAAPDAAQVLLRWNTSQIINGRFLRGRTFIPGLSTASVADGNVAGSTLTSIQTALDAFIATVAGFGVWHRPVAGGGGDFSLAVTGSVWAEFGMLRRRRQ